MPPKANSKSKTPPLTKSNKKKIQEIKTDKKLQKTKIWKPNKNLDPEKIETSQLTTQNNRITCKNKKKREEKGERNKKNGKVQKNRNGNDK